MEFCTFSLSGDTFSVELKKGVHSALCRNRWIWMTLSIGGWLMPGRQGPHWHRAQDLYLLTWWGPLPEVNHHTSSATSETCRQTTDNNHHQHNKNNLVLTGPPNPCKEKIFSKSYSFYNKNESNGLSVCVCVCVCVFDMPCWMWNPRKQPRNSWQPRNHVCMCVCMCAHQLQLWVHPVSVSTM